MRVTRTMQGRATIEDISPEQLTLLVDAIGELNRPNNPVRPFSRDFQQAIDLITLRLSKGLALFTIDERVPPGVPSRFHLRVVRPTDSSSAD